VIGMEGGGGGGGGKGCKMLGRAVEAEGVLRCSGDPI